MNKIIIIFSEVEYVWHNECVDLQLQRMVRRFNEQVFQRMSPERRARNLTVMKALARTSGRSKNKENRDLLNNMALPFTFNHSTPMKNEQVTDLDVMDQESGSDMFGDGDMYSIAESNSNETVTSTETSNPELVISKLYDLVPEGSDVGMDDKGDNLEEMEVIVTEDDLDNLKEGENPEAAWKSLEVLDGIAEYEFYRSLEHSKMVGYVTLISFAVI